jgi:hypothetical protein
MAGRTRLPYSRLQAIRVFAAKLVEKLPDNPPAAQSGIVGRSVTGAIFHDGLAHSVRDKLGRVHTTVNLC